VGQFPTLMGTVPHISPLEFVKNLEFTVFWSFWPSFAPITEVNLSDGVFFGF